MQSARIINFLIFLESVKNIFCIVTKFLASCNCCIKIMKFVYSVSLLTRSHHGFLVFSKPLQGTTVTVCVDKLKCLLQILKKIHPLSVTHVTTKGHADVHCLCCSWSYIDGLVAIEGCVWAKRPTASGSVLIYVDVAWLIETILKSISHAAPRSHIVVNVLHCYPGQRLSSIVWVASEGPVWLGGPTVAGGHVCGL